MRFTRTSNTWPAFNFLLMLGAMVWPSNLRAEPFFLPREDFWVTDGLVSAVLETNGIVYVGGLFSYVSPSRGSGVSIDIASGKPNRAFPQVNGFVYAVAPDGSGGWYIGGPFTSVGGVAREGLAHIRADGNVNTNWDAKLPAGAVYAIAVTGQKVVVGGFFFAIGGQLRDNIAALDSIHGDALDWDPGANDSVTALTVSGNTVYAGGNFTRIGGQPRDRVAAVDVQTGQTTPWNPGVDGEVAALSVVSCETVYVAGRFTTLDGQPRNGLAAVDVVTGRVTPWNPNPTFGTSPGQVLAIAVEGDAVFAGGFFASIGGEVRISLAAVDAHTGAALPWNPRPDGLILSLAVSGNTVYAGGQFSIVGATPRSGIAAIDSLTGEVTGWNPETSGLVYALGISENSVYAGGEINFGGTRRKNLASFDAATGKVTDWNPGADNLVSALAFAGGKIYAAGKFTSIGGVNRTSIAALDPKTGEATDWDPHADSWIFTLIVTTNTVYAGGNFGAIGGQPRANLAALDLNNGKATSWNPGPDSWVNALALAGDTLYVGGNFTNISGRARHFLAALDTVSANATEWNPVPDSYIGSLAVSGNTIYAAGGFANVGGLPRNYVAALDAVTGRATPWNPRPDTNVFVVVVTDRKIYLGGSFVSMGDESRFGLADFDLSTGALTDWSPPVLGPVLAIAAPGNRLYAGGFFSNVGLNYRPNIAAFPPDGSPVIRSQPRSLLLLPGETARFDVNAFGDAPLSYQWLFNGTNVAGATTAALVIGNVVENVAGAYTVVVSNSLGLVQSAEALLTVFSPIVITAQPVGQTVAPGGSVTLKVTATGSPPPFFQWRLNGVSIPTATAATFTLTNAQPVNGGSYDVVVANIGGAVKSELVTLTVASQRLPFADRLADRASANSPSGIGSGSNTNATRETGEPRHVGKAGGKSLWYAWRAPANGIATFRTRGSAFDTVLAIYTGSAVTNLVEVAGDDDHGGFLTSEVAFNAVAGTEYLIAIDGFGGASGNIVLGWNLDTAAPELPRIITPPLSQTVPAGANVVFSTLVSSRTPVSYQWFYNCAPIPFANNAAVTISNAQTAAVGSYTVRVSNSSSTVESLPAFLEIGADPKARSQDKFQDLFAQSETGPVLQSSARRDPASFPSVAAGVLGTQNLNNFNATTELGEPLHAGVIGGASRWFKLTATDQGVMLLDTIGSDIDTVLAVYTGTDFLTLNLIASDNNSAPDGIRSLTRFGATKNTDYLIAVDGINGVQGNVKLNWALGIAPAITNQPGSRTVPVGEAVTLTVGANGVPAPSYQWRFNGTDIPGATNATMTIGNFQPAQAGSYAVAVSNFAATVTSVGAVLTAIESKALRFTSWGRTPDGLVRLRVLGASEPLYVVQASTNLVTWSAIATNAASNGSFEFIDSGSTNYSRRFYRVALRP